MNVSEMYAEAGRLLNDPLNQRWTPDVLLSRFNFAATKVLAYTSSVKTLELLTPTAGNPEVQLDTDVIDIIRVDWTQTDGSIFKLQGYLRDQLDFQVPNWQQLNPGQPLAYWWDGTNQRINLIPTPSSDNIVTNGLKVWEVQNPAPLADVSDIPFSSNAAMIPYHLSIVHWAVAQCWMDDATPESLAKSKFHASGLMDKPGQFELEIKRILAKFDSPEDIPAKIMWRPTGGRLSGSGSVDRKANPI